MNPQTRDYRDTVRAGEKTGSAFQGFPNRRRKVTTWDVVSTVVTIAVFLILLFALPWEGGW